MVIIRIETGSIFIEEGKCQHIMEEMGIFLREEERKTITNKARLMLLKKQNIKHKEISPNIWIILNLAYNKNKNENKTVNHKFGLKHTTSGFL